MCTKATLMRGAEKIKHRDAFCYLAAIDNEINRCCAPST